MPSLSSVTEVLNKQSVLFLSGLIIVWFAFHDVISSLFSIWMVWDESYGHGILVAITSLFLTLRALSQNKTEPISPEWYFTIPLIIASLLLALAAMVGVDLLQYLLIPAIILLSFGLLAGHHIARRIILPVGLLYFAVPVWDYLNNTLVFITTEVVQYLIAHTGITAYISGNSIFIPSGELVIAAGCSGLRYFIIGTFLGVLAGYLNLTSFKKQLQLVLALSFLSLVANWVRVYGITLIAYQTEMQSPLVKDHELMGWVLFMSFMMPLIYMSGRNIPVIKTGLVSTVPDSSNNEGRNQDRSREFLMTCIACILLWLSVSVAPFTINRIDAAAGVSVNLDTLSFHSNELWESTPYIPDSSEWQPQISAPETANIVKFEHGPTAVIVYEFLYVKNRQQKEILPYVSNMYDRDHWAIRKTGNLNGYKLLELVNKRTEEAILVLYRFNVGGHTTSAYLLAKLYQFLAILKNRPYALFTAITTSCSNNCEVAQTQLESFIQGR